MWIGSRFIPEEPDISDEFLLWVSVVGILIFIVLGIWGFGCYKADEHTKQMNCEHEFVQKYEFKLFRGEELVTRCWKCGIKEE